MWLFVLNLQDIRFLLDDIQELKPTIFSGVPRVYDRIYSGINHIIVSSTSFNYYSIL